MNYYQEKKKMSERNKGEEKLLELAKEYIKFLKSEPKIRFNLHEPIGIIQEEFEFILANL